MLSFVTVFKGDLEVTLKYMVPNPGLFQRDDGNFFVFAFVLGFTLSKVCLVLGKLDTCLTHKPVTSVTAKR